MSLRAYTNELEMLENAGRRAMDQAIKGALQGAPDLPVRALAMRGAMILGEASSTDIRSGNENNHAELIALSRGRQTGIVPDTVVVTMEPCEPICQSQIPQLLGRNGLVAFITSRHELSDRGLVNPRRSIFDALSEKDLGFRVVQLTNPALQRDGLILLDHLSRDVETGHTTVDIPGLQAAFPNIQSI